jgi:hypothetical protein
MAENEANLGNDSNLYRLVAERKEGCCLFIESEGLMTSSLCFLIQREVPACKGGGIYAEGGWFDSSRRTTSNALKADADFREGPCGKQC